MRNVTTSMLAGLLLAFSATAWAEPAKDDPLMNLLSDNGFVSGVSAVRQNMSKAATELVVNAMAFLGVPYRMGGNNADSGFDCSGFVRSIYEQSLGLVLPRRAAEQAQATQIIAKEDLKPGDLVFFNTMRQAFSHVGIYVGDGKFIHSPRAGSQVRVEDMRMSYWAQRFNGARRVEASAIGAAAQ